MSHRGPHPADRALFAAEAVPVLREAVADLSWLRGRGYSDEAALALVGNRFQLKERARMAASRAAASDAAVGSRAAKRVQLDGLAGRALSIDGFNVLVTSEAALAGGVIVRGRDGALRDLSSVHGTYRRVDETEAVIAAVAQLIADASPSSVRWLLDRPVSNSGRVAAMLRAAAPAWQVELVDAPDPALAAAGGVIATADSWILDRALAWIDLPAALIAARAPDAWLIDLM